MLNPRILLRVILWSLGAAAVLGATAVLMGGEAFLYRIVGTLSLTALCCGLLFWVTCKLSDPSVYPASMLATALVVIEFGLGVIAIWEIDNRLFGVDSEYCLELIFILVFVGVPAVVCLRYLHHPQAGVASAFGLILCVAVLVVWLIGMDSSSWQGWECDNCIYDFGLLMGLCLIGVGVDRRYWRWVGVASCIVGCGTGIWYINSSGRPWPAVPMTAMISTAILVAHANVALRCPLKRGQKWVAYSTVAAAALGAIFWNIAVIRTPGIFEFDPFEVESFPTRFAAAFGIIAACGSLALVILWRINQNLVLSKRAPVGALDVASLQVAVICPICERKQKLGKNGGICPGCGLQMKLILEEPRCQACGYSLLMNSSDRCPECGAVKNLLPIAAV